jgi:hypothetical protein
MLVLEGLFSRPGIFNKMPRISELVEGIAKAHTDKYKEITNYRDYVPSCTVTSLPVWDLEYFKHLFFLCK